MLARHFLIFISVLFAPCAGADDRIDFERLKQLVGTWKPADTPESPMTVQFELIAGDTVLTETWRSPSHRSMTVYHLDAGTLLATHYCPQGNQPRLARVASKKDEVRFEFRDGTNVDVPGKSHSAVLTLQLQGDVLTRGEVYAENGKPFDGTTAGLEFRRFKRAQSG